MKIKISRGHRTGSICFNTSPTGKGRGRFWRGNYFFSASGPVGPNSPFACDPGKSIIRGRDGEQRPGEMNSGAPGSHCGGMKGAQGLINVYRGSCYQNHPPFLLSPKSSVLNSALPEEIKNLQFGLYLCKHPICFQKEIHQGRIESSTFSFIKKSLPRLLLIFFLCHLLFH